MRFSKLLLGILLIALSAYSLNSEASGIDYYTMAIPSQRLAGNFSPDPDLHSRMYDANEILEFSAFHGRENTEVSLLVATSGIAGPPQSIVFGERNTLNSLSSFTQSQTPTGKITCTAYTLSPELPCYAALFWTGGGSYATSPKRWGVSPVEAQAELMEGSQSYSSVDQYFNP